MDPSELAWLAGLLEGEGSFMMSNSRTGGKVYRYPRIVVNMTDRDVVDRVSSLFGTSTYPLPKQQEGRKPAFRALLGGSRAADLMAELRPWMGDRRRQRIDEVLAEYGALEPVEVRRRRACSESARARWAAFGTREGSLR